MTEFRPSGTCFKNLDFPGHVSGTPRLNPPPVDLGGFSVRIDGPRITSQNVVEYHDMPYHIISWGHQFHQLHEFHPRHHSVNRLAWGFATDNDQAQAPRHESRSPRSNVCPAIIHEGRTGRQLGFHADDPRRTQGHLDNKLVIGVDFPMSGNDTHGFCLCIFNSGRGVGEWREGWG